MVYENCPSCKQRLSKFETNLVDSIKLVKLIERNLERIRETSSLDGIKINDLKLNTLKYYFLNDIISKIRENKQFYQACINEECNFYGIKRIDVSG